jgi:diphthamide biosynthesis protein 7
VACMHDGFKVVQLSAEVFGQPGEGIQSTVLTSFNEHESLAYGVDWSVSDNLAGLPSQSLVASGSFYDHSLKTWLA